MSTNTLILGLQWGDEGKGKIVDALAERSEAVCRFQGGHNAGHTLKVDGEQKVLHLVPSGILHPKVNCVLGNGLVLSLPALAHEISDLKESGINFVINCEIGLTISFNKLLTLLEVFIPP